MIVSLARFDHVSGKESVWVDLSKKLCSHCFLRSGIDKTRCWHKVLWVLVHPFLSSRSEFCFWPRNTLITTIGINQVIHSLVPIGEVSHWVTRVSHPEWWKGGQSATWHVDVCLCLGEMIASKLLKPHPKVCGCWICCKIIICINPKFSFHSDLGMTFSSCDGTFVFFNGSYVFSINDVKMGWNSKHVLTWLASTQL